jgi:exosortase
MNRLLTQYRIRPVHVTLAFLIGCVIWAMWSVLAEMALRHWAVDPTYSHGYLVPMVALLILWMRRDGLPTALDRPAWWGLGLLVLGMAMQFVGAFYYVRWLSGAALLAYLGGIAALLGGAAGLRWAAPAIAFLVFMIPLPYRVDVLMRAPLQKISSRASGTALELLGVPVVVQGNVIALDDVELGVIDACSGLKMFIVFFCLATAFAILAPRRNLAERLLILLSAAPIAIFCNVARITATGLMHELGNARWADLVFHDLAGWLMMPLALALLWCELRLLSALFVEPEAPRPTFRLPAAIPIPVPTEAPRRGRT